MRKNKDGYVLIYVVIVIIFLCIVAVGTCTVALNNLKTQTAYIEQMQDRYEAEGAIELYMAEVCTGGTGMTSGGYLYPSPFSAVEQAKLDFSYTVTDSTPVKCIKTNGGWTDGGLEYVVTLETTCGSTKAIAEAAFLLSIATPSEVVTVDDVDHTFYRYTITGVTSKYLSYTLESAGGEAE